MNDSEIIKLNVAVTRLARLAVLQSSAIMQLSAAVLSTGELDNATRSEIYEMFTGLQEHIDILNELKDLGLTDGE
ncbi:hypothetical protein [Pseudomonas putida]|uniref:Uncharacterized protein n=1 Tax=Pseudomonas putida TaxID=303 RepID=A0A1Q9R385_PSEPU|nr:hypothetical protein [Pseudomonas putida]OLS61859.1 hypothetical protein PSEMO_32320 [Pseudomonas putida]